MGITSDAMFSSVDLDKFYTPEELLAVPDEKIYELVGGRLVERYSGGEASWIAAHLGSQISVHGYADKLGHVFGPDCGYQIFQDDPNKVRRADLSFIARGRLPNEQPPDGHVRRWRRA